MKDLNSHESAAERPAPSMMFGEGPVQTEKPRAELAGAIGRKATRNPLRDMHVRALIVERATEAGDVPEWMSIDIDRTKPIKRDDDKRPKKQPIEMQLVDPRFRKPPHGWHLKFNADALAVSQPGLEAKPLPNGGIVFMADQALAHSLQEDPHFLHHFIPEERPGIDPGA